MLRVRLGGINWLNVERALPIAHSTLAETMAERVEVSATVAFRVAKALDTSLHHVLSGEVLSPGDLQALRAVERRGAELS